MKKEQPESIADRIKEIRRELGNPSQSAFGKPLGVSKSAVSQWERGETEPSPDNLFAIEARYRYRAKWILKGDLPKKIENDYQPPVGTANLDLRSSFTPRDQALLDLFHGLTLDQQEAVLRDLETTQRRNVEIFEALNRQRKTG